MCREIVMHWKEKIVQSELHRQTFPKRMSCEWDRASYRDEQQASCSSDQCLTVPAACNTPAWSL